MASNRHGRVSAAEVRAAMFGTPVDGVVVVRQARRLTETDSDELVLVDARGVWWVARRISGSVDVWVYVGEIEAEDGFERLVTAAREGELAWQEATRELLQS